MPRRKLTTAQKEFQQFDHLARKHGQLYVAAYGNDTDIIRTGLLKKAKKAAERCSSCRCVFINIR